MPLKYIEAATLEWVDIYFNNVTQQPWHLNKEGEPFEHTDADEMEVASFGLKRITTREFRDITNRMYRIGGKGKSSFEYGTAAYHKILAACKKCRNVGDTNDPEREMPFTEKVLDALPQWVSDRLLDVINEMNSLNVEMEED